MSDKKIYSFMDLSKCVGKNGEYTQIVLDGTLSKIESKVTPTGKQVVTGTMAINNRAKGINSALGTSFGDAEVIWADVEFWEKTAENLLSYLNTTGAEKVPVTVVGAVKVNSFTTQKGEQRTRLVISVRTWKGRLSNRQNNGERPAAAKPTAAPPVGQSAGFNELSDDYDDSDLPF